MRKGNDQERLTQKAEKRKRRRKRRRIIFCVFLLLVVAVTAVYVKVAKPRINEAKTIVYDKLSNINENTFVRLENTKVYDISGKLVGEVNSGGYTYASINNISKYIQNGYIAMEDQRFKTHNGIDVNGMVRAGWNYVKSFGNVKQGGSTITQQVVKNTLLSQEKTINRKITEIFLAPELEKEYTKTEIMEFYCNSNYYGNRCYGVGNASSYYFHKKASEVTLSEAALLVGLSNNPSKYDPVQNYKNAIRKRNVVLHTMLKNGSITQTQYDQAVKENIKIAQYRKNIKKENYQTSFAVYCGVLELMKQNGFEFQYTFKDKEDYQIYKEKYSEEYKKCNTQIRNGGYQINTSLNSGVQKQLQKSVDDNLQNFTEMKKGKYKMQGAAVCIDNSNHFVVAVVGGRGTDDEYNRSYISYRQPGSTIKPLIDYAPAFESGEYYPSKKVSAAKGKNGPSNFGGGIYGDMTIREAIMKSINTAAWNLLESIGVKNGLKYLGKMKFSTISYVDNKNLPASLGGFTNGVRVVDMAKGYSTLQDQGSYSDNTCIRSMKFKDQTVVTHTEQKSQVFSSATAYMITDCLKDVVNKGTGTAAKINDVVLAGKTGTTNSYKDAWFCGYSQYYTTAVWMGYDKPKEMPGITGGSYPAAIFKTFMQEMHKGKAKKEFVIPDTVEVKKGQLFAKEIDETQQKSVLEVQEEREKQAASEAVKAFEAFTLTSVEKASNLDDKYNTTVEKVNAMTDEYEKNKLRKRVEDHYSDLEKEYNQWQDGLASYDEKLEQERIKENEKAQRQAKSNRQAYQKQNRIDLVNTYIDRLNSLTEYNEETPIVIDNARAALEKCSGYPEYDQLKADLDEAIIGVESLNTQ